MDRGYVDFERLYVFTLSAAFFVVRTKSNALLQRRYSHSVDKTTGVRSDQQCVHLDCGFVLSEFGPGKQRRTRVDGGRIQRVQTLLQLQADRIRGIQRSCEADQNLCEVGIDTPVMRVIGVG